MGYVFDALNRADDEGDNQPQPQGQGPVDPAPSEPKQDADTASTDTPADHAEQPADAQAASDPRLPQSTTSEHDDDTQPVDRNSAQPYRITEAPKPGPAQPIEPAAPITAPPTGPRLRITSEWIEHLDDRLVALTEPSSQLTEEYRAIRTTLLARWEHQRNLVHTITSATPQEGKTITSLNLGLTFAELRNRKTVVVEADLRLPTFNKLLHLDESKGMVGYLRGEAELDDVIQELEGNALHIITAGSRASNDAVQLLSNQRMANLLQVLRTRYDHVIIDTPPVIELADAGILGGLSDEVMLIARISRTPKPLIEQALRALKSYNAPVAGVIATDQKRSKNRYHYYRYGYRYRYRYYAKRAA